MVQYLVNMNTKNKFKKFSPQGGFIDMIFIIIAGLVAMRFYGVTFADLTDWLKNLNSDQIVGWFKAIMDWIKNLLESVGGPSF